MLARYRINQIALFISRIYISHHNVMHATHWQIWVDTGGTFTDCLALAPDGNLHRSKVLSNSTLRGSILQVRENKTITVRATWLTGAPDLLAGYSFRLLQQPHPPFTVVRTDSVRGSLSLSELPENMVWENADFEITAHEEAPILAARLVTGTPLHAGLPPLEMRLGSTKGTNALLERQGSAVGLLITKGFADLLDIGTQQRPDIFALRIEKPSVLYQSVVEVRERLDAQGKVLIALNETEINRIAQQIKQSSLRVWAIALLHSYLNPVHEQLLRQRLQREGIAFVSCSSELAPTIKIQPRAETAVVNAYLSEVMENYLAAVQQKLPDNPSQAHSYPLQVTAEPPLRGRPRQSLNHRRAAPSVTQSPTRHPALSHQKPTLRVMTSAGGLVGARFFKPKDSLLSGPAGGVVGAASVAALSGITKLLTLDMGGTSTDVARYDGAFDYQFESKVGAAHLFSPSLAIETVAAGGGSICWSDGLKSAVGPQSAGAWPGPACYGAGGPLTITDVNLLLGRLDAASFGIPVNRIAAEQALSRLQVPFTGASNQPTDEKLLEGFLRIANEKMAEAIRKISVSKGYDPASYTLLAFGGAGGQHACQVAELLRMRRIVIPYDAGLLSAYGMGQARIERFATRQVLRPFGEIQPELKALVAELSEEALSALSSEGLAENELEVRLVNLFLRFKGQDASLEITYHSEMDTLAAFRGQYELRYGHWVEDRVIELESVKVMVSTKPPPLPSQSFVAASYTPEPTRHLTSYVAGAWQTIPVFTWENLQPGASIPGPALVVSRNSTALIEPDWQFVLDAANNAILTQTKKIPFLSASQQNLTEPVHEPPETVQLELFTNRFRAIAEEMGALLQRTAFSVNVKERLDFSCALLDADGELVANAPHIPVHLGSLGLCVRLVRKAILMEKGDVIVTNHPGFGGSHLPDITLISPVYFRDQLIGYVANRAHHAEMGGKRPGSMPPDATSLAEEGVVIPPVYLVRKGTAHWDFIQQLLTESPYPTRALTENLADLNAALASIQAGAAALAALVREEGIDRVSYFMRALKNYSAACVRKSLAAWPDGGYSAEELLDDGTPLRVHLVISKGNVHVDFTGSAHVHPGNLNANPAIVHSAVMYVLRLLTAADIPLNEGIMQAVELIIPPGILNPVFPADPSACPAVVGGNTETSQRLVDTLIKALELAACSQGTMNNLLFGNDTFGYYETIGGGSGAINGFAGASAVHTHMTNTRITDPEILEFRYPVRLEKFAIRRNSGGKGKWNGGDGIIREITFLEPVSLTVLAQHRLQAPYGMAGGKAGLTGKQQLIRADGRVEELSGTAGAAVEQGDRVVIQTPGGGGYGIG